MLKLKKITIYLCKMLLFIFDFAPYFPKNIEKDVFIKQKSTETDFWFPL